MSGCGCLVCVFKYIFSSSEKLEHNTSDSPLFPAALVLDEFFPIYFLHCSIHRNFDKEAVNRNNKL